MKKFFSYLSCLSLLAYPNCAYCAEKTYNYTSNIPIIKEGNADKGAFLNVAFRTKHIQRWSLFNNTKNESLNDHLMDTSRIAHMLALIKNKKYGGKLDENRVAVLAAYHDVTEVISGDMPTPIKHITPGMKPLYSKMEDKINKDLLSLLPKEFEKDFSSILNREENEKELWQIVKYADQISAFIKCLEEKNLGNKDFDNAYSGLEKTILEIEAPEVKYFIETFLPSFGYKLPEKLKNN